MLCCARLAQPTDPNRLLSQYMREHWGSDRGFTGGAVTDFAQTPDGYLWIGTEKGLIRFDGTNFRAFQQANPIGFPIGPVQQLLADTEGNLWILLESTKILRYHNGKFELGRDVAEVGITSIAKRIDGTVLFASLALGTLTYREGKFESLSPSLEPENSSGSNSTEGSDDLSSRLSWATGVTPHRFAEPNSAVLSMAETSDGRLWLGTRDKGLYYARRGRIFKGKELSGAKINCLLALDDGLLWVGTDKGLMRWNGTELTTERIPSLLRGVKVSSMLRDLDANMWVGTSTGLIRVNADGVVLDTEDSHSNSPVTALFEDREGNIWVGGPRRIDRLRDSPFITYSLGNSRSESGGPVYVDHHERAWFAPFEGGLQWRKGENSGNVTNDGLSRDVIYSITGSGNELWIGRQQGGLTHLRYSGDSFATKSYTQRDGLAQNSVYAVFQSRDGSVWAGTLSGGVSQYWNGHFTTYTTLQGMASNTVAAIAEGPGETMWFATPNGLNAFSKGQWRVFRTRDGLPSDDVNCLLSDSKGVLWIGTASGIAFLQSGHVQIPGEAPAALREQILGIEEDKNGWLWIATSNHVLRVKRDKLVDSTITMGDVREYGVEDGLQGVEGVKRYHSVFADPAGKIWYSMNRGISVVDPARTIRASVPAIVHIEGVSVDGTPTGAQGPLRLPGVTRRITFSYAGLSLSIPERVRFKYKLEGIDDKWSEPATTREATYNNLGSGAYTFRVLASNSDGLWNSSESAVPFEIEPLYWQSWWFRLSVVLACALGILLYVRLRIRKLATQMNIRFDERLAERSRIAQELHDTLLQGFLSASMQLHIADDRLPEDSPAKPLVGRVLELMTRVMDEGRNTLRGLRRSETTSQNLEEAFSRIQQELAVSGQTGFRVLVEGIPRRVRPAIRDEIYFIGREALSNAFRHSGATQIEMEIEYAPDRLHILVRDNGCGIDPQVLSAGRDGHWGLSGMRERAERIGAKLRVLSRAGAGSEIELSVPGRLAFESETFGPRTRWVSWLPLQKSREEKIDVESEQLK